MKVVNTKNKRVWLFGHTRQIIIGCLILGSFLICLTIAPVTHLQTSNTQSVGKVNPTPEEPLDQEELEALIEKLKESLEEAIEDEDDQKAILEKWEERMEELEGKTEKQVLKILFEDVKAVVDDQEITDKLWEEWNPDNSEAHEGNSSPGRDVSRFNSLKKIPLTRNGKTWTFSTSGGPITFTYSESGGVAEFKPNSSVGKATIAWIQVARTGGKDRWYTSQADINTFSKNNANFVLRTDAVYGFRVDKTKGENTPFWEQTNLKPNEALASYKLGFDVTSGVATTGGTMRFSDNPDAAGGLARMKAADSKNDEYRFYFLLSPMNTETGEIYGTVEWGVVAQTGKPVQGIEPSLVKSIPELKGRDLAFDRWNTVFSKQYKSPAPFFGNVVYPIPGQKKYWGK